jgi:hypothetical protein
VYLLKLYFKKNTLVIENTTKNKSFNYNNMKAPLKNRIVIVRLTDKQQELLDKEARKHEQTRSEFVRTHFINLLNTYSNEKTNSKV